LHRIFVPPAPYDGGVSIDAAQLLFHGEMGHPVLWTVALLLFPV